MEELWVLEEPCIEDSSDYPHFYDTESQDLIRVVNDNTFIKHLKLSSRYKKVSKSLDIRPSLKIDYVANPNDFHDL